MQTSLPRVIGETIILALLGILSVVIFSYFHINIFLGTNVQPELNQMILKGQILNLLISLAVQLPLIVIVEEIIFRFLPYRIFRNKLRNKINYWIVGIISSSAFAMVHIQVIKGGGIPYNQFFMGLYYWSIIKYRNGLKLAILSHLISNMVIITAQIISSLFVG